MSNDVRKFLDEEWKHDSWEYRYDAPFCVCGQQLRDDSYPFQALDEHRVQVCLAAIQSVSDDGHDGWCGCERCQHNQSDGDS